MAPRSMLQKIGLICLASSVVPSTAALSVAISAAQALGVLQQRDSTCFNSTFNSCTSIDSNLPSDFCCPSASVCISLDSSSSALCCPSGSNCTTIKPITCSIDQQNVTLHPGESVMTTKLDSSLPRCGSDCCPFGYACDTTKFQCRLITDTSSLNPSSSSSAATTSTMSTSSSIGPTSSATAAASNGTGINSNNPPITTQCTRFPGAAVAAGFFPGMLAGALLALLGVICLGKSRHKSSSATNSPPSKFSSHSRGRSSDGAILGVSEPIPISQAARTDFLRRQPEMSKRTQTRMKSWFSSKSSPTFLGGESPYNNDNNWKMPTPPVPDNVPLKPLGAIVPVTPERQITRGRSQKTAVKEPSMESIKVYSPASMIGSPQGKPTPVKPIRNMTSQWRGHDNVDDKLSPFRTPDQEEFTANLATTTHHSTDLLTPARYNAEGNRGRLREDVSNVSHASRPTTTFTDMLGAIGFPDPGPAPPMPRGLDVKKKGKRI